MAKSCSTNALINLDQQANLTWLGSIFVSHNIRLHYPFIKQKIIISKLIISVLLFQLVDILHYDDYIHMHDNMLHV